MGLDNALDISVSAINAERFHLELIASNVANINTTRTSLGGVYKRQVPVYHEKQLSFSDELSKAENNLGSKAGGVGVAAVDDKSSQFQKVYNPGHPDADENGYVTLPNVSLATEMTDLVYANDLYTANITVFNATKKMQQDTLQLQ